MPPKPTSEGQIAIVIGRSINLSGGELLDSGGDFFAEISEPPFRANLFRLQRVETGVDRNTGNPMLERHTPVVLVKFAKDFDENHLNQVFFADPPRQMRTDKLEDERMKVAQ